MSDICKYYHDKYGGQCYGMKNSPLVECDGLLEKCVNDNMEKEKIEMVNHPAHYNTGGIECIDALAAATAGLDGIEAFCTANAIKYLWRWKWKNGVEDLDKAIWYINHLKESLVNKG